MNTRADWAAPQGHVWDSETVEAALGKIEYRAGRPRQQTRVVLSIVEALALADEVYHLRTLLEERGRG